MVGRQRFKVVHNGYKIEYLNSIEEVEAYINSVLEPHKNLRPRKIMDRTFKTPGNAETKSVRLVRYRYNTVYEEDFLIDEEV